MNRGPDLVMGAAFFAAFLIVGIGIWGLIVDSKRPTFSLKKSEWRCSKSETRLSHMQPMQVGQTTIMMPVNQDVCLEYKRIAG